MTSRKSNTTRKAKRKRKRPEIRPKAGKNRLKRKPTGADQEPLSQTAIADRLGISRTAFAKSCLQHSSWPFSRQGPWSADDLAAIELWRKENLQQDRAARPGGGDERAARVEVLQERARRLRLQNDVDEGDLHSVSECDSAVIARIHALKASLLGWSSWLAPELVAIVDPARGESKRREVQARMRVEIERLLRDFAGNRFEKWATIEPGDTP